MNIESTRKDNFPLDVVTAAYLHVELEKKKVRSIQESIAAILEVKQSTVSRLLKQARAEGWLKDTPSFAEEKIKPEQLAMVKLRAAGSEVKLKEHLDAIAHKHKTPTLLSVTVCECFGADQDERLIHFGRQAAREIQGWLPKMQLVGVAWGRTLRALVDGMREEIREHRSTNFIPLCGEPIAEHPHGLSSSVIAIELRQIVQGKLHFSHQLIKDDHNATLLALPAYIRPGSKHEAALWEYIEEIAGYRSIFGGRNKAARTSNIPLVERMDSIMTSVGRTIWNVDEFWGDATGLNKEDLGRFYVGNIAGTFIEKENLSKVEQKEVKKHRAGFTGVERKHVEACAQKAIAANGGGVITLGLGSEKAEMVIEGIKWGLINRLIVDNELCDALLKMPL